MMSATSEGGRELSEPAWMIEDGGYADYYLDAARKLRCRTQRSLTDLIRCRNAGHRSARGGSRGAGSRSPEAVGPAQGREDQGDRSSKRSSWESAFRRRHARDPTDGTGDQWQQPADPEWAYAELQLLVSESPHATSQSDTSTGPVRCSVGTPLVGDDEPSRRAPKATINLAVQRAYDHADANQMKPPNVREIAAPVQKLLAREGLVATDRAIQDVANGKQYRSRRRRLGSRLYNSLLPFSDQEM